MNSITPRTATEALLLEKFQALLTELDTVGDNASYGHVPDTAFDSWGHDFLSRRFGNSQPKSSKVKPRSVSTPLNKPMRQSSVRIVKKTEVRKTKTKTLTTSNNHITISRRHRRCNSCRQYSFPVESLLGLDNNYTCGARRLIAFAVAKSSYETAAFQLKEFGCLSISHQTVSNLVPSLSDEVQSKLHNNDAVRQAFQEAKGDTEFTTDGAFIKIRHEDKSHCRMECKVAVFAKWERFA